METRPTCPAGLPHPLTTHSTAPAAKLRPCLLPTRMPSWSVKASWAGPAPLSAPPCSSSSSPALPACPVCAGGSSSAPLPIPPPATSHQLPSESRGHLLQPAAQLAPGKSLLPFARSLEHALGNRYKPISVRQANGSGSTHHKMIGREMSYQRNSEPQSMRQTPSFPDSLVPPRHCLQKATASPTLQSSCNKVLLQPALAQLGYKPNRAWQAATQETNPERHLFFYRSHLRMAITCLE